MTDESLVKAQIDANVARERLLTTAREIRSRLEPAHILDEAVADVRGRSKKIAQQAGDAIREHPEALAAAAAAGAFLVVRRPLFRGLGRLFGRKKTSSPFPPPHVPKARRKG